MLRRESNERGEPFFFLMLAALLLGCTDIHNTNETQTGNEAENENESIMLNCTVKYVDLEGGFYGLICGDEKYYPINLPEEYRQDGLRVSVVARITNATTFAMWGTPVEVLEIRKV